MLSFDNEFILECLMVLGGEESIYLKGRPAKWIDLHGSWILAIFFITNVDVAVFILIVYG